MSELADGDQQRIAPKILGASQILLALDVSLHRHLIPGCLNELSLGRSCPS